MNDLQDVRPLPRSTSLWSHPRLQDVDLPHGVQFHPREEWIDCYGRWFSVSARIVGSQIVDV